MAASATSAHLPPLLREALEHMPSDDRNDAARVIVCLQAGFGDRETAKNLGVSFSRVRSLRDDLGRGVVAALGSDGYSPSEVIRYLGVATAVVMQ